MALQQQGGEGSSGTRQGKPVNNAQYAYQWLVDHGYSRAGAAGIVGNLVQESGVNPGSNQAGGPGMGIAQWSQGGRWDTLVSWANQHGMNPSDLNTQLNFLNHEMRTSHAQLYRELQSTSDVNAATVAFQNNYEIPNPQYANTDHRVGAAQAAMAGDWRSIGSATARSGGGSWPSGYPNNPNHVDKLNPQELALHYGWAYSFLKSVPQLAHLFEQAVAGNWSPIKFAAELRNTDWFQNHSATMRKNLLMQESDPASFKSHVADVQSSMADAAAQMGVALPPDVLDRLATHAFLTGMTSAEMQNVLAAHLHEVNGQFSGSAGDTQDALQAWADQNGVRIGNDWMSNAVRNVAAGNKAQNFYTERLTQMAQSAFPGLAAHLDANTTVQSIADPYVQAMSNILEKPTSDINLFNPTIRKALSYTDPSTGKVGLQSMYDFENTLRQDPQWLNTQNAHDAFGAATHQLLQQWGVQY